MFYQTSDDAMLMEFYFVDYGENIGWRVYIISDIDYMGRDESAHGTHRNHFDGEFYKCICWQYRIDTLDDAMAIASLWADVTSIYIRLGRSGLGFDEIVKRLLKK